MLGYLSELYHRYMPKSESKSFYYLSLIKDNDRYSIHGLWPQLSESSYPKYCKKVTFTLDTLNPIIDDLNKYWYSNIEKNEAFWKHEYEKHGSCMFINMSELEYFKKTLELYNYVLENNLLINYIDPNSKKIYKTGSIYPQINVPFRQISQNPTQLDNHTENNPPILVYDTSGAYSDPSFKHNINKGIPKIRQQWIEDRQDTETLSSFSSIFHHESIQTNQHIQFPNLALPKRAKKDKMSD